MKLRVLVSEYTGCFYWRLRVPFVALAARGHTVRMTDIVQEGNTAAVHKSELMVVQRTTHPWILHGIRQHNANGGRTIYEIDDDVWNIPRSNPAHAFYRPDALLVVEEGLRLCDLVVVSTPQLADVVRRFNANVAVAYNAADPHDMAPYLDDGEPEDTEEFRLGWGGSSTHIVDFETVVAPLTKLMRAKKHVRFIFVGGDMRGLFPPDVRARMTHAGGTHGGHVFKPPSLDFMALVAKQRLHAAIAPIAPIAFNRSKSYCKLIEYGAHGIPAVASSFGPYREYAAGTSERVVLLASSPQEWYRHLCAIVEDHDLRARLRAANRAYVRERHMIESRVDAWEEALLGVPLPDGGAIYA